MAAALMNMFKVGQTVQLRSGGKAMSVESIDGDKVTCIWMDGSRLRRETLPKEALVEAADEGGKLIVNIMRLSDKSSPSESI